MGTEVSVFCSANKGGSEFATRLENAKEAKERRGRFEEQRSKGPDGEMAFALTTSATWYLPNALGKT